MKTEHFFVRTSPKESDIRDIDEQEALEFFEKMLRRDVLGDELTE